MTQPNRVNSYSLQISAARLRVSHQAVKDRIGQELKRPAPCTLTLQKRKREKVKIKEELTRYVQLLQLHETRQAHFRPAH